MRYKQKEILPTYTTYEDGTDRVFRNVGIQNSDAGELPRRNHTKYYRLFYVLKPGCTNLGRLVAVATKFVRRRILFPEQSL
jgi:hypothetical protein